MGHTAVSTIKVKMLYIRYILNIKENKIKTGTSIVLYLRQNHSTETNEVSGIIFEYCVQYFSDTSGRVSIWEGAWFSNDKYI